MKIDLLVVWPQGFDYPLFRKFIKENRQRFNRVIVVFTNNHTKHDLKAKIEEKMKQDDVAFMVTEHTGGQDWRDTAVKAGLGYSDGDWVWFTEQDFFIKDPEKFFKKVVAVIDKNEIQAIGFYENSNSMSRLHPACLFASRKVINQTSKNFATVPDVSDHFSIFSEELHALTPIMPLHTLGLDEPKDYYHMAGLTHNLRLREDRQNIYYKPEEFAEYLKKCSNDK